jgi:hypothetical protein
MPVIRTFCVSCARPGRSFVGRYRDFLLERSSIPVTRDSARPIGRQKRREGGRC